MQGCLEVSGKQWKNKNVLISINLTLSVFKNSEGEIRCPEWTKSALFFPSVTVFFNIIYQMFITMQGT